MRSPCNLLRLINSGSRARFIVRHTISSDVREREMTVQDDWNEQDAQDEDAAEHDVGRAGVQVDDTDEYLYADVSEADYYR